MGVEYRKSITPDLNIISNEICQHQCRICVAIEALMEVKRRSSMLYDCVLWAQCCIAGPRGDN